jgi:hypothetical protein
MPLGREEYSPKLHQQRQRKMDHLNQHWHTATTFYCHMKFAGDQTAIVCISLSSYSTHIRNIPHQTAPHMPSERARKTFSFSLLTRLRAFRFATHASPVAPTAFSFDLVSSRTCSHGSAAFPSVQPTIERILPSLGLNCLSSVQIHLGGCDVATYTRILLSGNCPVCFGVCCD